MKHFKDLLLSVFFIVIIIGIFWKMATEKLPSAAAAGNKKKVKLLLNLHPDTEYLNDDGKAALHLATSLNKKEVVDLLLDHGVDINVRDKYNYTPLMDAVKHLNFDLALHLIAKGADINLLNNSGNTALFYLLGKRAPTEKEKSTIPYFILEMMDDNIDENKEKLLPSLISEQVLQNKNKRGETALDMAISMDDMKVVEYLLEHGVDINSRNEKGECFLHNISSMKMAKFWIEHGIDINCKDKNEETPLFKITSIDMAKLFLDNGANLEARNKVLETPVMCNEALRSEFIELGADLYVKDKFNDTLLHKVVKPEIAKLLIVKGVDVNTKGRQGETALHQAVQNTELLKLLLEAGADVNIQNDRKETALFKAAAINKVEAMILLLNYQTDISLKNIKGQTIFDFYKTMSNTDEYIIKVLTPKEKN